MTHGCLCLAISQDISPPIKPGVGLTSYQLFANQFSSRSLAQYWISSQFITPIRDKPDKCANSLLSYECDWWLVDSGVDVEVELGDESKYVLEGIFPLFARQHVCNITWPYIALPGDQIVTDRPF